MVCFVVAGKIWWYQGVIMMAAAIVGGYLGARVARKIDPARLRTAINVLTFLMTAVVFYRTYR